MFNGRTHYINHFRRLINMERDADIKRHEDEINRLSGKQREKKGRALLGMRGKRAGRLFGNQHMVKYMKMDVGRPLPEIDMNVGDVVVISQGQPLKKGNPLGTIVDKGRHAVTVLFDGTPDKWMIKQNLRIDLYVNDVTYRRMQEALDVILYGRECSPRLMGWLIAEKDKYMADNETNISSEETKSDKLPIEFMNTGLNESQRQAVFKAISADDFYIVHGPPGTGKTVTGVEILCQAKSRYSKLLATADSNGAVDNIALGLLKYDVNVVRLGQPFKVSDALKEMTLDARLSAHSEYKRVDQLRDQAFSRMKDQEGLKHPSPRWTRGMKHSDIHRMAKKGKGSRGVSPSDMKSMSQWLTIREEVDKLFAKADALEAELTQEILRTSDVILATNSGAGQALLEGWTFDMVLIDEATQSTESSALVAAVKAKRLILLGDHHQLPPTVISQEAQAGGFSVSLLERLVDRYKSVPVSLLDIQYRMNKEIMAFPNEMFYEGRLRAASQNANWHMTFEKARGLLKKCVKTSACFIDVQGEEKRMGDSPSIMNKKEADVTVDIVKAMLEAGVSPEQIGLIAPYKAQAKLIESMLDGTSKHIQVDTVDGFQGQEKDIIVLSLVRSNSEGQLGFLNDVRRLNVALTRAKKLRIVVGNSRTIENHEVYRLFLESSRQAEGFLTQE